eukprot:5689996-Prymnesium_polylepis.1
MLGPDRSFRSGGQCQSRAPTRTLSSVSQRAHAPADAPRFNGSVSPAYVERSTYVCPAKPYRPSRLYL